MFIVGMCIRLVVLYGMIRFVVFLFVAMDEHDHPQRR